MRRGCEAPEANGFTLIELLMVMAVVAILFALAAAVPKHEEREGQVRGAAEELAAVFRETRVRAMRENRMYGVAFNIQNAPGSSGRILNNRSGGHWYRVIGPNEAGTYEYAGDGDAQVNRLPFWDYSISSYNGRGTYYNTPHPIDRYLAFVERSWINEPVRLAKGKVRFLALTDQDNGDCFAPWMGTWYSETYPRPWFGWWDQASGRLHTWGGYDPTLKMTKFKQLRWWSGWDGPNVPLSIGGRPVSHSGFFYEGFEGEISGSVNPNDRYAPQDSDGNGIILGLYACKPAEDEISVYKFLLMKKGAPRPLIDAGWLDFVVVFRPDGMVQTDWFRMRRGYSSHGYHGVPGYLETYDTTFPVNTRDVGVGDRCVRHSCWAGYGVNDGRSAYPSDAPSKREATDYADRSGYYWITLGGDVPDDADSYPSAEAALRTMLPIYRVGVSPDGGVKVVRVHTTNYEKRFFDTTITGAGWQDKAKVKTHYTFHALIKADGSRLGMPVTDVVLPEMLRERKWWWEWP